ncbi:hypothetical protein [Wenyingzhuangia sp. IMCC45467]
MKNVTKNNLELNLKEATSTLLEMARNSCWNNISENTSYIISEIKNDSRNFKIQRLERKKANRKKKPVTLKKATTELKSIYENLYDINLEVFKSRKNKTIVDIRYYPKSALESDHYEKIKNNEPMLHCKVGIPPYVSDKSKKYDVNWELGGIRHEWNTFWNRIQLK